MSLQCKVAVLGNCQSGPIRSLLMRAKPDWTLLNIPPVHTIKSEDFEGTHRILESADIVIFQPLGPTFGVLATNELKVSLPGKTFVSFPSIYFSGFFPQLTYLRQPVGGAMKGPLTDYHDARIIDSFLAEESPEMCLERISFPEGEVNSHFDAALKESTKRDQAVDVAATDLIIQAAQFQSGAMFTFNHPTNWVLFQVVQRILKLLSEPLADADFVPEREFLGNVRAAIPPAIQKLLSTQWKRDEYYLGEELVPMRSLIDQFYKLYASVPGFRSICFDNRHRFNLSVRLSDTM